MADYNSNYTGQQIDGAVYKVLHPDSTPTTGSTAFVISGGIKAALDAKANSSALSNYYTKSETEALISIINQFSYQVANTLPTASASTMYCIYFVPSEKPQTQNTKDEYITVQSGSVGSYTYAWEKIGSTELELPTAPGIAEGIADTVSAGTAQKFGYRQSGGDGVNYMKRIKGNTVIWNQVYDSNSAFDRDGIYKDAISNGGVRIHGTCSGSDGYVNLYNFFNYSSESGRQVVSGHKYAILGMFSNASVDFVYLHEAFNNISITADSIVECTQTGRPSSSTYIRVTVSNGQSVDFTLYPIVVDLTLLFNGNIPSGFTIDDFKALFPEYGLDYNAGQLAYNDATAIETKGEDNAWTRRIELGLGSFHVKNAQGVVSTITGGLKSNGTVYDEILDGTKYIKRTGVRAHAAGDDSDSSVITDGTNTVYALTAAEEYSLVNPVPNAIMVDENGTERAIGGHAPFACDSNYSISVKNLLARLNS